MKDFFLIERFRFLIHTKDKYNQSLTTIYNMIYSIMFRVNESYNQGIFSQNKLTHYLTSLEEISDEFKSLNLPLSVKDIRDITIFRLNKLVTRLNEKIQSISQDCGATNIDDTFYIATGNRLSTVMNGKSDEYSKLLLFFNKMYVPTSYKIYRNSSKESSKDLTIYNNKNFDENDEMSYDYYNIGMLDFPSCKPLIKKNTSMIEHINGARIYIPYNTVVFDKKSSTPVISNNFLVMNGYFIIDSLNLSRIGGTIGRKNIEIVKELEAVNISDTFKNGFLEQMSIRDFLVYSNNDIIDKILVAYNKLNKLKEKTISALVKEFLNKSVEGQREILTLFLLVKDNIEVQYLAYLMYDMISNESYLLKPQPLAENVYNSLHWSIQKIFKTAIKSVTQYSKHIIDFSEEDIPYEKRIFLMKVPKSVKIKAMDKYKEISNKGSDSSTKSQQYLDGLLRIPFGNYKKEKILTELDNFKETINNFLIEMKSLVKNFSNLEALEFSTEPKSNDIDKFIMAFKERLDVHLKFIISDSELDDPDFIEKKLSNLEKLKVSELKERVKIINNIFGQTTVNDKQKKKNLIEALFTLVKNIPPNNTKRDVVYTLANNDTLYNKDNLHILDTISNKFNNIENNWKKYNENTRDYVANVKSTLDSAVYQQNEAKLEIERIVAQWINGDMKGYCFGFEGPPGTGKTSLAKKGIAKVLKDTDGNTRPFAFIAIGGSSNASTLEGHSYTYVGSTWGKIVDILIETKCMNPIIYIDELDKISQTENGREIIGILTHLTDSTQNDQFTDKYFAGIDIDLSKVLFIFSYNDFSRIDPILADRIHRVKFRHLSKKDKVHIIENYILPEVLETVGFNKSEVVFSEGTIEYIINNYTYEAGVRKVKEKIFDIIREINLRCITKTNLERPINITTEIVKEIFSNKPMVTHKLIAPKPHIGLVNGLYATTVGIGGITIIETFKMLADSKFALTLTGQQGDVMKESMMCAKTIAWNLLPDKFKKKSIKECEDKGNFGIHIHCPEAATPKDGPSAGAAITLAIVSLLTGVPVNNKVALTGEIDLNGSVHMIGGLDIKIDGGKQAGVETILCPKQNHNDLEIIKLEKPEILEGIKIIEVETIWEVLEYALMENKLKFQKYIG
jgi:endopeptidase La